MNLYFPPTKVEELLQFKDVIGIETPNNSSPSILVSTKEGKLSNYYLNNCDHPTSLISQILVKQFQVGTPSLFGFSGTNVIHCAGTGIRVNNRSEIRLKSQIGLLEMDDSGILVGATKDDMVCIVSVLEEAVVAEMKFHRCDITALRWRNSLVLSGDSKGVISLWDINRCVSIDSKYQMSKPISWLHYYMDHLHHNVYYGCSREEKKISWYDLRSREAIGTTNGTGEIVGISQTHTGKVILANPQGIALVDIYKGFSVSGQFQSEQSRLIRCVTCEGKYVVVGCSNGSVEVYDTDILECLYSFGISSYKQITRVFRLQGTLMTLNAKGILNSAFFI